MMGISERGDWNFDSFLSVSATTPALFRTHQLLNIGIFLAGWLLRGARPEQPGWLLDVAAVAVA